MDGKPFTLVPLTPKQVYEDQVRLYESEQKRSEKKERVERKESEGEKNKVNAFESTKYKSGQVHKSEDERQQSECVCKRSRC